LLTHSDLPSARPGFFRLLASTMYFGGVTTHPEKRWRAEG
jgi:hypothetical protein